MADSTNFNLSDVSKPGYLGSAKVVSKLVGDFVHDDILGAAHHSTVMPACVRMSNIFSGKVEGYTPVRGWEKDITSILYRRFKIDPSQTPEDMLTTFFADLAEAIFTLVNTEEGPELDRRITMTTNAYAQALLGINGDFAWATGHDAH